MPIYDGEYYYATNVISINAEKLHTGPFGYTLYEHNGNHNNAIGQPDGDSFRINVDLGASEGYIDGRGLIVCFDFEIKIRGSTGFQHYSKGSFSSYPTGRWFYGTNDPDAWGIYDHASWVQIEYTSNRSWYSYGGDFQWRTSGQLTGAPDFYRYFMLVDNGSAHIWAGEYAEFQAFRVKPNEVQSIFTAQFALAEALVCDHEFGDTLYLGLRDTDSKPIILWVDWDFADSFTGYKATSGSSVGVQTVETRDTCIAYGQFGTNKQIIVSEDKLVTWDEAQGEFGNDDVLTLEFHPSSGSNLIATRKVDQDYVQTLTQRAPWTDLGATLFVARSQLRVRDDVWIGSDTGGSSVVQLLSGGSWADRSTGLPNVPINDLESA